MLSSSRLRRASVAIVPALLLASLAACGGTKAGYGDSTQSGLGTVTVSGAFGKAPSISWNAQPAYPDSVQTKTLVQGTGAAVDTSAPVEVNIYISDPLDDLYAARTACHASASASASASTSASSPASSKPSSGAAGSGSAGDAASASSSPAPTPVTVTPCPDSVNFPVKGSWVYQSQSPETLTLSQDAPIFQQLLKGAHVGSRVEALAGSADVFPAQQGGVAGNPSLGVGTKDPLVMVVDVVKLAPKPLSGPKGTPEPAPSWAPKVKLDAKKNPAGFDFTGIPKPSATGALKKAILIKGTGPAVKASDTLTVNYYGMTYGAKTPFDESYSKQPYTQPLSNLVQGWQQGLVGVPVGSRVLLQIPPSLGYGSQATGSIPANSTLYFVLDVLGAS